MVRIGAAGSNILYPTFSKETATDITASRSRPIAAVPELQPTNLAHKEFDIDTFTAIWRNFQTRKTRPIFSALTSELLDVVEEASKKTPVEGKIIKDFVDHTKKLYSKDLDPDQQLCSLIGRMLYLAREQMPQTCSAIESGSITMTVTNLTNVIKERMNTLKRNIKTKDRETLYDNLVKEISQILLLASGSCNHGIIGDIHLLVPDELNGHNRTEVLLEFLQSDLQLSQETWQRLTLGNKKISIEDLSSCLSREASRQQSIPRESNPWSSATPFA